jgi:hypothetical protein
MCNGSTPNCEVAFMECEKCSVSLFVTTKNKSCGHERKYVITEAVLYICPVSQYKSEIKKKK